MKNNTDVTKISAHFLSLFVLVLAMATEAFAQDDKKCTEMSFSEIMEKSNSLAVMLRLATMRADYKAMMEHNNSLEAFVASCPEMKKPYACSYDCGVEQGRFYLFKARSLRLLSLSARGDSIANSTSQQFAAAAEGERKMNEAKARLMANGVQGKPDATEAFRSYVKKDATLSALRAKLLMTSGDIYYARVSDNSMAAIGYAVSESLRNAAFPGDTQAETCKGDEVCAARKYYGLAMWEVSEAAIGLPGGEDYASARNALEEIRIELRSRLASIDKGLLFIGIDPYEVNTIPMSELLGQLNMLRVKLKDSEDKIEMMVKDWSVNKTGRELQQIDEKRYASGRDIGLKTYKISVLEQQARQFGEEFSNSMQQLSTDTESLTYLQQLREVQFQLSRKVADAQNEIRSLETRRSQDLLSLQQNVAMEKRNELRWLINMELTTLNLAAQEQSLNAQVAEYELRISRNKNRQAVIANELRQKDAEKETLRLENIIHDKRISQLKDESTKVYGFQRKGVIASICQLENDITMLGGKVERKFKAESKFGEKNCEIPKVLPDQTKAKLLEAVNNARKQSIEQSIRGALIIRACVVGLADVPPLNPKVKVNGAETDVTYNGKKLSEIHDEIKDCAEYKASENTKPELQIAKELKTQTDASIANQVTNLEKQISETQSHLEEIVTLVGVAKAADITVGTIMAAQASATSAMQAMPSITVAVAGLASGTLTTVDIARKAKDTFDITSTLLTLGREVARAAVEFESTRTRFLEQVHGLENSLSNLKMEKTVRLLQADQMIQQIYGKSVDLNQRAKDALLTGVLVNAEYSSGVFDLNASIARGIADHDRFLIQLETMTSQNDLIGYNISIEEAGKDKVEAQKSIIASQKDSLNLEILELTRDTTSVLKLKDAALGQLENLNATRARVMQLNTSSTLLSQNIMQIFDSQKALFEEKYTKDKEHIEKILNMEKTNAQQSLENINAQLEKVGAKRELLKNAIAVSTSYNAKVEALRKEILDDATHTAEDDKHSGDKSKVYLANDTDLSLLVRGVDDYLETKSRILEQANFVLAKLRTRYRILTTSLGSSGQAEWGYVLTSDELDRIASAICTRAAAERKDCEAKRDAPFYDTTPVVFDYVYFKAIPATSALVRTLEEKGQVSFEVSPSSAFASEDKRNASGWLSIGDQKFAAQDAAYLIDVRVAARYECPTGSVDSGQVMSIMHEGDGFVPVRLSPSSEETVWQFASGPMRLRRDIVPNLSVDREATCVEDFARSWKSTTVRDMPEKAREFCSTQSDDNRSAMQFFGAPLYGRYKIARDATNCPIRSLALTFVYTKKN